MIGFLVTSAYALVGWAFCGAIMMTGLAVAPLPVALAAHAILAPVFFAALARVYFTQHAFYSPMATAGLFVGVVIALDVVVVALLIERSFGMFRSVVGTWLPIGLIFAATVATGHATRRRPRSGGALNPSERPSSI